MSIFVFAASIVAFCIIALYLISLHNGHNASIDVGHGIVGLVTILAVYLHADSPQTVRAELVTMFVALWGLRLFIHLYFNHKKTGEHHRHAHHLSIWQARGALYAKVRTLLQTFILQGVLIYITILPGIVANTAEMAPMAWYNWVGAIVWVLAFFVQTGTDNNLYVKSGTMKNNREKKLVTIGLWHYTRHPNYLAEVMMWFGLALICLGGVEHSILAFISPVFVAYYVYYVVIPMAEKKLEQVPAFASYKARTPALFPGLLKK
jgi:steroid 5-alpha reductase family enzyme